MKLLLFCPHFRPDLHAATGEVMTELVYSLAKRHYEVSVVTSLPWYRGHAVEPEWRGRPWRTEKTDWGQIVRVWPFPTDKSNIVGRLAGFAGMTSMAAALGARLGRHDIVMGMSPPIFFGDAAWTNARIWRVPMVFNVQDIFPDVAVELGALSNQTVISLAERYERSLYRRCDAVTVLSEDQAANVRAKLGSSASTNNKVKIIQNFVDGERIKPVAKENDYRRAHNLEGKKVVMYSGNVGLSQSFDLIRVAAEKFADRSDVVFVINGEGAARSEVENWAEPMSNVRVVNFGRRQDVPDILGAADLHLVLLKTGLARSSTPSKLYGIMAAGRPLLASVDEGSEVAAVIEKTGAGLAVGPEDEWAFVRALDELLADPLSLDQMGDKARSYAETWLTPDSQAEAYDKLFRSLVDQ